MEARTTSAILVGIAIIRRPLIASPRDFHRKTILRFCSEKLYPLSVVNLYAIHLAIKS
jgi:hypothetical protein